MNFAILFDQQNLTVVYRFIDDVIEASRQAMMSGRYNPFVIIDFVETIPEAKERAEHYKRLYMNRQTFNQPKERERNEQY